MPAAANRLPAEDPGPERPEPILQFHHVTVRFGARTALEDVSFALPAGTISALVGRNGAGKTTLLRTLTGALRPTEGSIDWALPERRGRVALVAQSAALYPLLTLRENCLAAGRMEGLRGTILRARADDAIARTLSEGMANQLAGRLSGGYARRAAIAAALMGDASLLVLDEPTAGLDADATEAIVAVLRGLQADGKTVLVATHDFAMADVAAGYALFLRDGRLRESGIPRDLCRQLFPARMRVEVTPAAEPGRAAAALLAELGASRTSAGRYRLFSALDAAGHPTALRTLREAGLAIREIVIRDPGMASLFERFCGDRLEA